MRYSEIQSMFLEAARGTSPGPSGFVRINCPACPHVKGTHDRKRSLGVNLVVGSARCFRCGTKCCVYSKGDRRIEIPTAPKVPPPSLEGMYVLWGPEAQSSEWHQLAMSYLQSRGIAKYAERANMHLAISGRFAGRILLPHVGGDGRLWGWSGRLIGNPTEDHIPRVLYSSGMSRERMYNDQALDLKSSTPVAVVEGVIDSLGLLPDAVAALGKPTDAHFALLMRCQRPVVFVLDGDTGDAGRKIAMKMKLRGFSHGVGYVQLPCGQDPGNYEAEELQKKINAARLF